MAETAKANPAHTVQRIQRNHRLRWKLLRRVNDFMDLPIALASIAMVLLALVQLNGHISPAWQTRLTVLQTALWLLFVLQFVIQFVLAPVKITFLHHHWLNALVVVVPFLGFLRLIALLQATPSLPLLRLLVFGGNSLSSPLAILRRRRLGQLLLISLLVMIIGAAVVDLSEVGVPGSKIQNFGDALWWAVTTVTTVGSSLDVVTRGGRVVGFLLMLYGVGVFSYVTASIASALVGIDQGKREKQQAREAERQFRLSQDEIHALRTILERAGSASPVHKSDAAD